MSEPFDPLPDPNNPNNPPDPFAPTEEELEMAVEEMTGQPFAGQGAEERVPALEKRIAFLMDQYEAMEQRVGEDTPQAEQALHSIAADIREARRQLAEWKQLHEGRN